MFTDRFGPSDVSVRHAPALSADTQLQTCKTAAAAAAAANQEQCDGLRPTTARSLPRPRTRATSRDAGSMSRPGAAALAPRPAPQPVAAALAVIPRQVTTTRSSASVCVGADGKLEGAFRIADKVESAARQRRRDRPPLASAGRRGVGAAGRVVVAVAAPRAREPSYFAIGSARRSARTSGRRRRRLARTARRAAYVARSMARKDASCDALWSGDTREAARHAEPPPSARRSARTPPARRLASSRLSYGRRDFINPAALATTEQRRSRLPPRRPPPR